MKTLDIHSHILPSVDDGPIDIEETIEILSAMKNQGITDVIATPHFVATQENLEEYISKVNTAYNLVKETCKNKDLPNIFLGSEVFYFRGIGKIHSIKNLSLGNSNNILLELPFCTLNESILSDIRDISDNLGITPIIAHIERYAHLRGFKNLLKLISEGTVLAQINCAAILDPHYKKVIPKLINGNYISFLATDTHSINKRPPLMDKALKEIEEKFGAHIKELFIENSVQLYNQLNTGELICNLKP